MPVAYYYIDQENTKPEIIKNICFGICLKLITILIKIINCHILSNQHRIWNLLNKCLVKHVIAKQMLVEI